MGHNRRKKKSPKNSLPQLNRIILMTLKKEGREYKLNLG